MVATPDDPRIERLLARWDDLRASGLSPRPSELTDDPDLLAALERAIAEVESAEDGLGLGPPAAAAAAGIPGRYEVFGVPLKGGMGEVYRARDLEVEGRVVAYKVMRAEGGTSPGAVAQFFREARITDKVRQPGVVPIYGRFEDGSGRPAYAMEFVEGETLGAARKGFEAGPADAERCVEVLRRFLDACRVVGVAHAKGVVHGDLNSRNILLIEKRQATRVVDWGSAVEIGGDDAASRSHSVAPDYRDPATGAGDPPTYASDVYALGIGLGKLARSFESAGAAIMEGRKRAGALRVLRAIAGKASASRPDERYPDAESLAGDLERLLSGQRVHADREEPFSERAWRWASRHKAAVTSAFAAAILGVASLAVILYSVQESRRARQVALSSQYGEIGAMCKMLQLEDRSDRRDDSDRFRVLQGLIEGKDEDSLQLKKALESVAADYARQNENLAQMALARRNKVEDQLNAGIRILDDLVREFPEREADYRLLLAQGYIDIGAMKNLGAMNGRALKATIDEISSGKPKEGEARVALESALASCERGLSLLPPLSRSDAEEHPARKSYKDAYLNEMTSLYCLGRSSEALQCLNRHLSLSSQADPLMASLRQPLLKVAESEQQRLPWSRPPAADHAKAVAMAQFLGAQEGVSDAAVYNAACACSLASVDAAASGREREERAVLAVGYLRRIADKGYFHGLRLYPPPIADTIKELKTDGDLDPIRDRPDFKAIIDRLTPKGPKGG